MKSYKLIPIFILINSFVFSQDTSTITKLSVTKIIMYRTPDMVFRPFRLDSKAAIKAAENRVYSTDSNYRKEIGYKIDSVSTHNKCWQSIDSFIHTNELFAHHLFGKQLSKKNSKTHIYSIDVRIVYEFQFNNHENLYLGLNSGNYIMINDRTYKKDPKVIAYIDNLLYKGCK